MAKSIFSTLFLLLLVFSFARLVSAQTGAELCDPLCASGCTCGNNFSALANKVITFLLTISVPIVSIMVLYGGFMMMTAGGEPDKFSKGKKTILYAAIGFLVVLLAKSVVSIIQAIF